MTESLHQAQQEYLARGLVVFPLVVGVKYNSEGKAKKDMIPPERFQRFDVKTVPQVMPHHNAIGLSCGTNSGVFAIDVDDPQVWYNFLSDIQLDEPLTWKQKSASQGFHLLFKLDPELLPYKGRANSFGPKYPGLDTRTTGGFLFLAPTVYKTDQVDWSYRWFEGQSPSDISLASLPAAVLSRLLLPSTKGGGKRNKKSNGTKPSRIAKSSAKDMKPKFFAVFQGRQCGVTKSWEKCEPLVLGFPGADYKAFATRKEAQVAYNHHLHTPITVGQQPPECSS